MPSIQNSSQPKKSSPLRPIKNAASRRNLVLNPPQAGVVKRSPLKSGHQSSSSPSRVPFSNKLSSISMPPPGGPHYNTDSLQKKQPLLSKFKPQKSHFPIFSNVGQFDKENYAQSDYHQPQPSFDGLQAGNFSLEGLYPRAAPKRTLLESAPIHESRPLKRAKVVEETVEQEESFEDQELPAPDSFPPLHDDGSKPSYSYAQLIGMSILRAPNRRLTLAQIYKWISDTFSFYSPSTESGWQNSIRHNLSLNKAFIKQTRPKNDTGKGNYWAIQPGMEHQFLKEKASRKTGPNENTPLLSTNLTPVDAVESLQPTFKSLPTSMPNQELPSQPMYTMPEPQLPTNPDLSSDATIPASDAFEPEFGDVHERMPSSPLIRSSPPPTMHSSPPVARQMNRRHDTPPAVPQFPSSSRARSHKRKFASMDDSGYFSSLDSSAIRPNQLGRFLASDADRPRIKRGRAEEEIARLRGSSYDSPSKGRAVSTYGMPSSSPFRQDTRNTSRQMLPPLTPALKLKAPTRPPPSVSPNTNLQLHRDRVREMVGSPLRGIECINEDLPPWDEGFTLDEASLAFEFAPGLDFFCDNSELLSVPGNGSPEKKTAKRPRLDRCRSANILADITSNVGNKSSLGSPAFKLTPSRGTQATFFNSPLKGLGLLGSPNKFIGFDQSPSKMSSPFNISNFGLPVEEEFSGLEFLSEEMNEFGGLDIMQGFQKIGGGGPSSSRSTPKGSHPPRQPLGRSFTSRF